MPKVLKSIWHFAHVWPGIYLTNFDVHFAYLLRYWDFFATTILAIKIKEDLHISYVQLFDYLCMHNIHNIQRYTKNENLKL